MKVYIQIFEGMDNRTKKRWECFVIARSPRVLAKLVDKVGSSRPIGKPWTAWATPCLIEILDDKEDCLYVENIEDYVYR